MPYHIVDSIPKYYDRTSYLTEYKEDVYAHEKLKGFESNGVSKKV